jgi:hypothetical protein
MQVATIGLSTGFGIATMNPQVPVLTAGGGGGTCSRNVAQFRWQNRELVEFLQRARKARAGMSLTPDERSNEMLRDARAGEMYGLNPND